jgi:hypothetical protein
MILRSLIAAIAGMLCGACLAVFLVFGPLEIGGIEAGPWRSNEHIGAPEAGPLVRAAVARRGLLALNRSETVYFTAWEDDTGAALREDCRYAVSGRGLPARWWSLTLYGEDDFLPLNDDNAHALTRTDLGEGEWSLVAGPSPAPGAAWLSSRNAGQFSITLRLYHPDAAVREAPQSLRLPSIRQLDCAGEPA